MPRKKPVAKAAKKKVVKKKLATKAVRKLAKTPKVAAKPGPKSVAASPKRQKPGAQEPPRPTAPVPKPVDAAKGEPSLGRPLVTQEEKLYMLFHDDYQCRQVFEFLRVETVKELEEFSPQQIVHLMSRPIRLTVDRIRQRLAQFKRSLKDDEQFAAGFRPAKPEEPQGKG